jgi:cation-transporting ATPase 13A3/4/5
MCTHYRCRYKRSRVWTFITWLLILISIGLLRLIFHWVPHLMLLFTHCKCSLEEAETLLLIERFQGKHTSYYVKELKFLTAQEIMLVNSHHLTFSID